jgi:hypothetical protein
MTDDMPSSQAVEAPSPEPPPLNQPLSSQQSGEQTDRAQPSARALAPAQSPQPVVMSSSRLTLTPEQLCELTGYKRGAEQARWLKENGFKFRLDRLGKPRVDRAHYEAKMGGKLAMPGEHIDGGTPNWAALTGA